MAGGTTERRPRSTRRTPGPRASGPSGRWLAVGALLVLATIAAAAVIFFIRAATTAAPGDAIAVLRTSDFHALAFSPDDSNVVFFGHHNGVMRSDDGGRTWRSLVERRNFDAMGLAVSHANSRDLYLAGHDVFQLSTDGGASWQPVAHDLPGTDIHGFAMSPDDSDRLYAFVVGHGVLQSADGGRAWQRLRGQLPGDVMALAAAGGSPETLYAGSMRSGLLRSTDGGGNWAPATSGLGARGVFAVVVDPVVRETVYAGGDGGLYRSMNSGTTWNKLSFPGENAVTLAVSPSRPHVILAITVKDGQGLVYRSEDYAATWTPRR